MRISRPPARLPAAVAYAVDCVAGAASALELMDLVSLMNCYTNSFLFNSFLLSLRRAPVSRYLVTLSDY